MLKLRKTAPGEPLILSMTAVRMGDRLLIVGCSDADLIAKLAARPGLTGRACIVDESPELSARAGAAAEREGALVEALTAPVTMLPYDAEAFDVAVISHLLSGLPADRRVSCLTEAARVLRGGGRCVVVQSGRRVFDTLLGGARTVPPNEIETAMLAAGFRAVRTIAERAGLVFVEGGKRKGEG